MKNFGYIKVASASFDVEIANVEANVDAIIKVINELDQAVNVCVFPELCLCGYTCQDLFYQSSLIQACKQGLQRICKENTSNALICVGLPYQVDNHLYNCAAWIFHHEVLGMSVKQYLPNYNEFYEPRWFSSYQECKHDTIEFNNKIIPFTPWLLINDLNSPAVFAAEICEDLWVPIPPSTYQCMNGANIIVNLSASNETIGKKQYRHQLIKNQSAKCMCGYVYSSANSSESSSDIVFSGAKLIYDNGSLICEDSFISKHNVIYGEIDVEKCLNDRHKFKTSTHIQDNYHFHRINIALNHEDFKLTRKIEPYPFVPSDETQRLIRCEEILNIQASGLANRLKKIHCNHLVVGISGGLDSTLALIVAIKAFELNQYDPSGIYAITMPGFGTTNRTHDNSLQLMELLKVTSLNIPIKEACMIHFKDLNHDPSLLDITYENTQARERTQILMDYANKVNGIVLGTGDLSELALGWCTYNGDHMSMYAVNASIPKTLVRYLVANYALEMRHKGKDNIAAILDDICATPVSPELLPPKDNGEIAQITEASIGSYDLHDFFLYHMLRNNYGPDKIYQLALLAFPNTQQTTIISTLKTFYNRFFSQQFKRNCLPDGVKVGSICLSPRGDWRMPSDASSKLWLDIVNKL